MFKLEFLSKLLCFLIFYFAKWTSSLTCLTDHIFYLYFFKMQQIQLALMILPGALLIWMQEAKIGPVIELDWLLGMKEILVLELISIFHSIKYSCFKTSKMQHQFSQVKKHFTKLNICYLPHGLFNKHLIFKYKRSTFHKAAEILQTDPNCSSLQNMFLLAPS